MRVLIVDDEPLARSALQNVLSARRDISLIETAGDGVEALEKLRHDRFDLVLLDVSMPELSGFGVIDALAKSARPLPAVVFVTAYHEHAIDAFDRQAVDYVLKPFAAERVHTAIDRAIARTQSERASELLRNLLQTRPEAPVRLAMKTNGGVTFIAPSEISFVHAEGNYVLVQCHTGSHLLREGISTIAERLRPFGFIRIHRSIVVNSAHVAEIRHSYTGEYWLKLRNGKEFPVTRSYKNDLGALASLWLGAERAFAE
jgi:two-component system LytT family response regulator